MVEINVNYVIPREVVFEQVQFVLLRHVYEAKSLDGRASSNRLFESCTFDNIVENLIGDCLSRICDKILLLI